MKSLEHIIREIREGKCCCDKKKESLENSIRKVTRKEYESSYAAKDSKPVEEAVGTIGTDKYQGNEFKSIRTATPHIKPPAGEGSHSQAPENASRQRSIAKEKAGINRVEEEEINELQLKIPEPPVKIAEPVAKAAAKAVTKAAVGRAVGLALGPEAMVAQAIAPEIAAKYQQQHKAMVPHAETPGVSTATSFERMKGFKVAPPKPAETRPEVKPQEKTKVAPAVEPAPSPKTEPKTEPKVAPATTPETKTDVTPKAIVLPQIDVPADTKTGTDTSTKPETKAQPAEEPSKSKSAEAATDTSKPKIALGALGGSHQAGMDVLHRVAVKTQSHLAKKHRVHEDTESRKQIENMPRKGDRKSIEYVGRKDADPKSTKEKTSRLATIKNVIDEAKKELAAKKQISFEDGKTKVYDYGKDILVISPDQRKVDLDVDNGEKIAKDYGK